jgi:molybdenum cofactor cytidylyltransferase
MAEVAIVLLAAGEARRMGSLKQLLDVQGTSMLRRAALAALASRCRPVVVVSGARAPEVGATVEDLPLRVVENREWKGGIGTSIAAGIRTLADDKVDAAILALADQPLISARVFDALIGHYEVSGLPIAASRYGDTVGAPALFDRSMFEKLLALPPDQGCKRIILESMPGAVAVYPCPEGIIDVDTPEEYGRVRTLVG